MVPNNILTIYDNTTGQELQYNLTCNYIEMPENLIVNLTPILQNNTLNNINGYLSYNSQTFTLNIIPLWNTLTVNLTTNLPSVSIYFSPLSSLSYISRCFSRIFHIHIKFIIIIGPLCIIITSCYIYRIITINIPLEIIYRYLCYWPGYCYWSIW